MVATVVDRQAQMLTLAQRGLVAPALHVVQQDVPRARPKVAVPQGADALPAAQLPAHHVGSTDVPEVVTHCPPRAIVVDFDASFTAGPPVHQPDDGQVWERETQGLLLECDQQFRQVISSGTVLSSHCVESPVSLFLGPMGRSQISAHKHSDWLFQTISCFTYLVPHCHPWLWQMRGEAKCYSTSQILRSSDC